MADYDSFAELYDLAMGNRGSDGVKIAALITESNPHARTVLELGTGTGSILASLTGFQVTGLDSSGKMIEVAKKKLPDTDFYHGNMLDLTIIDKKFDAIICVFDTINHLLDFNEWEAVFDNVYERLNEKGVFIFDINTAEKLRFLVKDSPYSRKFNEYSMVMNITEVSPRTVNWNVRISRLDANGTFDRTVMEENIKETSFEPQEITAKLEDRFSVETRIDSYLKDSDVPARIYFICTKKP